MGKGKIKIEELVWDDLNVAHIARHGVKPAEVQEALAGRVIINPSYAGRLLITGQSDKGRMLAIVIQKKHVKHRYYVVTARPAGKKERREYDGKITNKQSA